MLAIDGSSPLDTPARRLVSIVLPTLREETIADALRRLSRHLVTVSGCSFELLLVDDSPEAYKRSLDEAITDHNTEFGPMATARRIDGPRRGKGAAVRTGIRQSAGQVVFIMDADLPVPLENIERFIRLIDEGNVVVVAERPFDRTLDHPTRYMASMVLFALQRFIVFQGPAFDDTQCGFKAFTGPLAHALANAQIVDGGMVDVEYLYAARAARAKVARVAVVRCPETRASKINVKRALRQDPLDLLRIKWKGLRGGYG